jgi:hypothetical protein
MKLQPTCSLPKMLLLSSFCLTNPSDSSATVAKDVTSLQPRPAKTASAPSPSGYASRHSPSGYASRSRSYTFRKGTVQLDEVALLITSRLKLNNYLLNLPFVPHAHNNRTA